MAKSGVPVFSQIGSAASSVGSAIGNFLNPKMPDIASAGATPNPATDPATAAAMQAAETERQKKAKGESANFLTSGGGAGVTDSPSVSRAVLLGN